MNIERRNNQRIVIPLNVKWRGAGDHVTPGTLGDISATGGYILTAGTIQPGENILLHINLPDETILRLQGIAIYQVGELGFTMQFGQMSAEQATALAKLIAQYPHGIHDD